MPSKPKPFVPVPGVDGLLIRGDRYYGERWVDGERIRKSLNTTDLRIALKKLDAFLVTPEDRLHVDADKIQMRPAFDEFKKDGEGARSALSYNTLKEYESLFKLWVEPKYGTKPVSKMTTKMVIDILENAPEGRRGKVRKMLSSFFTIAAEDYHYCTQNLIPLLPRKWKKGGQSKTHSGDKIVLSEQHIDAIAANFKQPARPVNGRGGNARFRDSDWLAEMHRVLFLLLCYTGLRIGEALALQVDDLLRIDDEGNDKLVHDVDEPPVLLNVERQKSPEYRAKDPSSPMFADLKGDTEKVVGKKRRVPIDEFLGEVLVAYVNAATAAGMMGRGVRNGKLLFPNTQHNMEASGHVWKALKAAAKRAGLTQHVTTHFTRHTYISRLVNSGKFRVEEISTFTGNGVEVIQRNYAHISKDAELHQRAREVGRKRATG